MTQGLVNSGATFQRIVHKVLGDMHGETAEAYVDDVNVGTDDESTHIAEKSKLSDRLSNSGVRVKFSKCIFGKREVTSLGHKISHSTTRPSNDHVDAIGEMQEPANGDSLRRFIDVANYFSQHIANLSDELLPFYEVLAGSQWNKKNFKRQPVRIDN